MTPDRLAQLATLSTPHLADGCLRTKTPVRCAPAGTRPLDPLMRCAGRVRPVRHVGSIDIYFEALEAAQPGDVLVVDNGGRLDEACVGDIVALEAQQAGIAGIVIWGLHRDASELRALGLPLFSLGGLPTGPQRLDPRPEDAFEAATVGAHRLGTGDIAVADANGVLFLPEDRLPEILEAAAGIRDTELRQLAAMRAGRSFRTQVRLPEYVARRRQDPGYGFRQHIREIQAAGEE